MPPTPRGSLGTPFKGKIGEIQGSTRKIGIFGVLGLFEFFLGVLGLNTSPHGFLDLLASILH